MARQNATPNALLKSSGYVPAQQPQPMHALWSTLTLFLAIDNSSLGLVKLYTIALSLSIDRIELKNAFFLYTTFIFFYKIKHDSIYGGFSSSKI